MNRKPTEFLDEETRHLAGILTRSALRLSADITRSMPVGVGGELQRSWSATPASPQNLQASVATSSAYFLPVELGRSPGKGISSQGQEGVALWARRKLGMNPQKARGFAFVLSRKYKAEGRPAQGLIGLARKGDPGGGEPAPRPVPSSLLDQHYSELEKQL